MSSSSLFHELDLALHAGRRAAALIAEVRREGFTVELKGPDDIVTRADREADELITSALAAAFPDDAVVAEESTPKDHDAVADLLSAGRVWFVDPLDGTRDFAQGRDDFAVMIGLVVGGRPVLGVIVRPTTGEALCGVVGEGAFLERLDGHREPLRVSTVAELRQARLVLSRSHRSPVADAIGDALQPLSMTRRGSIGVKVSELTRKTFDVYVHSSGGAKLWDACAPEALLIAAGGRFSDVLGAPIDYERPDLGLPRGILATNGALHDAASAIAHRTLATG